MLSIKSAEEEILRDVNIEALQSILWRLAAIFILLFAAFIYFCFGWQQIGTDPRPISLIHDSIYAHAYAG